LKVSANVKIAMQCFEFFRFRGGQMPPLVARLTCSICCVTFFVLSKWLDQCRQTWGFAPDLGFSMPFWVFLQKI